MAKSAVVQKLDEVQGAVNSFLRPLGFRKKGRTHNRRTTEGLVQALDFQMGAYPIGEGAVIPGFTESYYGKFTINLGVLLPCVYETEEQRPLPDFVQECYCTIRARLGSLAYGRSQWFELADETSSLARTIVGLLDRVGLPFFEQFATYADVLAYFREKRELPFQGPGRAALEAALIAHHLGDGELCRSLLLEAWACLPFPECVSELARRIGYRVGYPG